MSAQVFSVSGKDLRRSQGDRLSHVESKQNEIEIGDSPRRIACLCMFYWPTASCPASLTDIESDRSTCLAMFSLVTWPNAATIDRDHGAAR